MGYSVSITQAGQMTLPKYLREKYGITNKAVVEEKNGQIVVERQKTAREELEEALAKIDASWTDEERTRIKAHAGLTFKQSIAELEKTPEGRAVIEAEYGEKIYA